MKNIFAIRKDERLLALLAVLLMAVLNGLMIYKYYGLFTRGGNVGYWTLFHDHFCVSGFDAMSYLTVSRWKVWYPLYRHPLLTLMMYPLYELNQWLMDATGINCAVFVVGALMVLCAVYAFLFIHRILSELVGLRRTDALMLTLMTFGFAYVMLSIMVPDHFGISLFLLTMTLYIAGRCMKHKRPMKAWMVAVLLLLSSGVTTTNGIKPALAAWFANGRKVFRLKYMLAAFVVPMLLMGAAYVYQYNEYVVPDKIAQDIIFQQRKEKDKKFAEKIEKHNAWKAKQNGKPLMDNPLFEWTSSTAPRWQSVAENLIGESVVLHQDYLLHDMNQDRPVIVGYRWGIQYVFVFGLAALFLWGAWLGRRERLMQLCLSWIAFDMLLHVGLAFGLTEVYIMSAHWLFAVPVALAYLLKSLSSNRQPHLRALLWTMTAFLWAYNGWLIANFMLERSYW